MKKAVAQLLATESSLLPEQRFLVTLLLVMTLRLALTL